MDKQNRLTKWEEWEIGEHYQCVRGCMVLGTYECICLDKKSGWVRLKVEGGLDTIRQHAWQGRFRKASEAVTCQPKETTNMLPGLINHTKKSPSQDRIELLEQIARLTHALKIIRDFDDGSYAAGKHAWRAEKAGHKTMRNIAANALEYENTL